MNKDIRIKSEHPSQSYLFPPSVEDFIDDNDLVRIVDSTIEQMNLKGLTETYKGGGAPMFNPKTMLKIIVYAYTQKIYSSRQIAKALKTNVNFMWIARMQKPDFRTINYFRGKRIGKQIEHVFTELTKFLASSGKINVTTQYLDGTKIEANANKYSFVWKKATQTHLSNLEKKIKAKLEQIKEIVAKENDNYGDNDLEEFNVDIDLTPEKLKQLSDKLNNYDSKEIQKSRRQIDKDFLPRLEKYEEYLRILGDRNSFSKTDTDATFMRMKEDPMRNGQTKAGYNVQIGTENQYITNFLVGQRPTDTKLLKPFIEKQKINKRPLPERLVADAGYGSNENYNYLEDEEIDAFVKYNYYYRETRPRYKPDKYGFAGMGYDENNDEFTCENDRKLKYIKDNYDQRDGSRRKVYESEDCSGCGLASECKKDKIIKRLWVNCGLERHKKKIRDRLGSSLGQKLIRKRGIDVETVFGNIKQNMGIKRFMLRGLEKVNVELGIIALAHNFRKLAI